MEPGTKASVTLSITGLITFANKVPFFDKPIELSIKARKCGQGEEYTVDKRCV